MALLKLQLSITTERAGVPSKASFSQWAQAAFDASKRKHFAPDLGLSIQITDDAKARAANAMYRQKDYATNVLSFPLELPPGLPKNYQQDWLGDLLIAKTVIEREALEQDKTVRSHYAHMTVHGVLHLLGYDHMTPAEAEQMEALEIKIMTSLGFANPY